jgi:hypothetical protein
MAAKIFATVETFARDVRHTLRLMQRDRAVTFTALATLAGHRPQHRDCLCRPRRALLAILPLATGRRPPSAFPKCLQTLDQET